MNWFKSLAPIAKLFAGPIGNIVNAGIIAGSASAITWAAQKGIPNEISTAVVGGLVLIGGTIINSLTGTQIVQIQSVRENMTNGVTVVPVDAARNAGIPSVSEPQPSASNSYNPNAG